jgi:hypothetical protein
LAGDVQVRWTAFLRLILVGAWYPERNTMLARPLGFIVALSGASYLAGTTSIAA